MRRQLALVLAVSVAALVVDAQVERGVASGVVYVGVVALTASLPGWRITVAAAAVATLLTVLGFFLSPEASELWKAGINRLLAVVAIWITAALVVHQRRLTERLEHAALRTSRSERQFGAAFKSVPVGLLLLDGGNRIRLVNRAAAHLFGYTPDEMLGRAAELVLPAVGNFDADHGSVEASGIDKQGRKLALDLGRTPVDTPDGAFVLATLVDRSDRQLVAQMRGAQATSRRMVEAEEAQRKRMAREVHDALGQPLTALKLDLGWLARRLTTAQPELHTRAIAMETLVARTIEEVRRLSAELRPAILDDQGLTAAVRWQADDFEQRTGLRCTLALDDDLDWDADRCTVAYRVLQEALTNVARHARASRVDIHLHRDAHGQGVLEISDDGCGIDEGAAARPGALGLLGMRERAALLNGTLQISSQAGAGTTISLRLPAEPDGAL